MTAERGREVERLRMKEVAERYRSRGYDVLVEPSLELPDGMRFRPDILARRGDETIVIEVRNATTIRESGSER